MSGEPWRVRCPTKKRHANVLSKPHKGYIRCKTCEQNFPFAIDAKTGEHVSGIADLSD